MAVLLAVVTRFIGYRLAGFRYNPFRDGLEWGPLLFDMGIFAALYFGFRLALGRLEAHTPRGG